jgi:hypothetical protein
MNWSAALPHRFLRTNLRGLAIHAFAATLAVVPLAPSVQTAHAQALLSPPDLLNLDQPLYAASTAQANSMKNLQDRAIKDVIQSHGLADGDTAAVMTWGRNEAQAELFAVLVNAVQTPAASRDADQSNAVAWLGAVEQRQAVNAAQAAGLEYVKWAGLNQSTYQQLLNNNAGESTLESFLSQPPQNFNTLVGATSGWCVYHAPAPYTAEYVPPVNVPPCNAPCPLGSLICNPPTPSYDQFVRWGNADASYGTLSSPDFSAATKNLALGTEIGLPLGAAAAAVAPAYVASAAAASEAALAAFTETEEVLAVTLSAEGVVSVVTTLIAAITTAIVEGITVVNAAKLPGQLATLITSAETTTPDVSKLPTSSSGQTSLFSLFVGATLPLPIDQTCDNSTGVPYGVTISGTSPVIVGPHAPCLNPTPILGATGVDPQFSITPKGGTSATVQPTLTWKDVAAGTTSTARLSGNWFIVGPTGSQVQTLRIAYTDWNGKEQHSWLVGNPNDGYTFVNYSPPTDPSTVVDPTTCKSKGYCTSGTSIQFVGSDGNAYSASVRPAVQPVGNLSPVPAGNPSDARMVDMFNTGSGKTEVHILNSATNYGSFKYEIGTALAPTNTSQWSFAFAPNQDLFAVNTVSGGPSGASLIILTAASAWQQASGSVGLTVNPLVSTLVGGPATPPLPAAGLFLPVTDPKQWTFQVDSNRNLYAIHSQSTASGKVEVTVLPAPYNQVPAPAPIVTALDAVSSPTGWEFHLTSNNDLLIVKMSPTGSNHTEVHILTAASNYQTYSLHIATPLPTTSRSQWQFSVGANNDLLAIELNGTTTGKTEVHRLAANTNYTGYNLEVPTALPTSPAGLWNFGVGTLPF